VFLFGLLVAIAFWPGVLDPASTLRWTVIAIGAPALLLAHAERLPKPLNGAGLATLIAILASILWSSDPLTGIDQGAHLIALAGVFCLGATVSNLRPVWAGMGVGMVITAGVAIAQHFGWQGAFQAAAPGGLSVNRDLMAEGGMAVMIAAVTYSIWWAIPAAAIVLLFGASKAAYGGMAAALALWLWKRNRAASIALFAAIVIVAILMVRLLHPSMEHRLSIWFDALQELAWLGHGLGSYSFDFYVNEHAHSEPIQMLYELGVFAALPFAIAYHLLRDSHDEPERYILAGLVAVSFYDFPLHMPLTAFAFALAAGHLAARRHCVQRRALPVGEPGESRDPLGAVISTGIHLAP
jgi:hypothetical protein